MTSTLAASYLYCERLARKQAGNFYHAFRILPNPQRRAMCALYAFLRVTDDLTDGPEAHVGEIVDVPFPRPRRRVDVLEHTEYYSYRSRIIDFLENDARQCASKTPLPR